MRECLKGVGLDSRGGSPISLLFTVYLQVAKNDELKKLNEDLLLSQRETLREVDELRVALRLARQGNGNNSTETFFQ